MMQIEKQLWATTADGKEIYKITLTNAQGNSISLCDIGAGLVSVRVPDRNGRIDDVVLGYEDPLSYIGDGACLGKIPGRFANRIDSGKFSLDGKNYQLVLNVCENRHHLHGGPNGFQNQIWDWKIEGEKVIFKYVSVDGEAGYPGTLTAVAAYTWDDENRLSLELSATTDKPTILNMTNHTYFNLNGAGNGNIFQHDLKLFCDYYLGTTDDIITTGELISVKDTPMDFSEKKSLGRDIKEDYFPLVIGKGYDSCWCINGFETRKLRPAAVLSSEASGRKVEVFTTQPGLQVYTGNWLTGSPMGRDGKVYEDYDGVSLECQAFPNSPNVPSFPNTVVRPGEEYKELIQFKFSEL